MLEDGTDEDMALQPLRQLGTYCKNCDTRIGVIVTPEEAVAVRYYDVDDWEVGCHYMPVPWSNSGRELTVNLTIWACAVLSLNDKYHHIVPRPHLFPEINTWQEGPIKGHYQHVYSGRLSTELPVGAIVVDKKKLLGEVPERVVVNIGSSDEDILKGQRRIAAQQKLRRMKLIGVKVEGENKRKAADFKLGVGAVLAVNGLFVKNLTSSSFLCLLSRYGRGHVVHVYTMYLPQFKGPKIGPFDLFGSEFNIEFLKKIGEGIHSVVWKVEISGCTYALKIFGNYEVSDFVYPMELSSLNERGVTNNEILNSWDPFINECRAYGRLHEVNKTDFAAKCYGYLLLEPKDNESVEKSDLQGVAWAKSENWKHDGPIDKVPIRTIVKEYIESERAFAPEMIPRMLQSLKALHKYGIIHRDIRAANYKEGLLVDFSSALTVPHYLADVELSYVPIDRIYGYEVHDANDFDHMIDEWNNDHEMERTLETIQIMVFLFGRLS
ncbi:hypothetical protein E0Z10_g9401 [Xylaria hypoxylon]|uniref:Protein kinase domain-containing protein n=1 Tax=Xylaria hypoxylon TaxID=37992 RepID=A0A4Z0YKJ0_9PEZI|nr:hypothetical protein E0Z10_g9401 [Xylaria hypoxylon]